ncbi:butyrophilin subfamily 1 member A1-like [Astyanax mexicanus]|uniref:butyrophilin subfamily 1 member A1-like n=1 Tax=Astyanax mexicanus TaxID=7994 RepID=UPI0020CAA899|nr:butyrophilin subfamily 1 member A1-like [Astyanax mexicanus]
MIWESYKTIKLSVEAVGSEPVITVEKYESGKFSLLCESKGWYPEPELQWRNCKGVKLTAETETQPVADLFNVKSRITVEKIDLYFCKLTLRDHEKEGAHTLFDLEAHLWKSVAIGVSVLFLVLLITIGVIACNCPEKGHQESVFSPAQWTKVEFTPLPEEELDLRTYELLKE